MKAFVISEVKKEKHAKGWNFLYIIFKYSCHVTAILRSPYFILAKMISYNSSYTEVCQGQIAKFNWTFCQMIFFLFMRFSSYILLGVCKTSGTALYSIWF